ncbi:uncharacterized protein LOC106529578 [Austrofundulus limnaeus]|uniref:Uncharacterized protein LOC106529578 n=1 Tax=Austrofundulus limnaeus TaxID=52670 RepID=A0A2I4CKJ1_AUSLI|nr:PREDICTED: uncharacterized protein LOC106529578 [Austrofundulus limnaeus]
MAVGMTISVNGLNFYSSVRQQKGFVSVKAGDSLTLQCFYEDVVDARFYWYRQNLGSKPKLISTFYKYETNGIFYDEFRNNPRFALDTAKGKYHLKITNLSISDTATYYCASSYLYRFEFAEGTTVTVKGSGSNIQTLVHQSVSETAHSGGSVTLKCMVQSGTCDGEHSVYWFRNTEGFHPGVVYTHGGRNGLCERKPNTSSQNCVYKLPVTNLNESHTGTYYCAVAVCGLLLFGNGTKLDFKYKDDFLTYIWSGVFPCTFILGVLLVLSVCLMSRANSCRCSAASEEGSSHLPLAEDYQRAAKLYYGALTVITNRSAEDPVWTECVYHEIKRHK